MDHSKYLEVLARHNERLKNILSTTTPLMEDTNELFIYKNLLYNNDQSSIHEQLITTFHLHENINNEKFKLFCQKFDINSINQFTFFMRKNNIQSTDEFTYLFNRNDIS